MSEKEEIQKAVNQAAYLLNGANHCLCAEDFVAARLILGRALICIGNFLHPDTKKPKAFDKVVNIFSQNQNGGDAR
jgi:hypothetical protein